MQFTTWTDLTDEQRATAEKKWPATHEATHEAKEMPLFEYHFDNGTAHFRRLVQTATPDLVPPKKEPRAPRKVETASEGTISGQQYAPRVHLRPCPFQPRKNFDQEKLNKMALSERNVGIISPIVVRPCEPTPEYPEARFEIIAGEQRWLGSDERPHPDKPGEKLPVLMMVPITVRTNLTDADVLELMLVENIQRNDLSEIEESDAFSAALAQRTADGALRYPSMLSFAHAIGTTESHVRRRVMLQKMPREGRKALQSRRISFETATVICTSPAKIVDRLLDEVLNPKKYDHFRQSDAALTAEETLEVKRARHVRELRYAPFDQADPNLVPLHTNDEGERVEGGACVDCPWNTGTQKEGKERGRSNDCLNPPCFQKKVDIHIAAELVRAKEQGCAVLNEKETAKIIQHDGTLAPTARLRAPGRCA